MAEIERATLQLALVVGEPLSLPPGLSVAVGQVARRIVFAPDALAAVELMAAKAPQLVVIHDSLPREQALPLLTRIARDWAQVPAVVVTASPAVDAAMQLARAGAADYVALPEVPSRLRRLAEMIRARQALRLDERFFSPGCPPEVLIAGRSPAIVRMLELIHTVAASGCDPVLVLGETGTGKELAARAVHVLSSGSGKGFVGLNCAALTASLLESELFGHVKGAFTGADRDKAGLFEAAEDGTLFLDEISEMPLELQAKLLRVLQERSFRRVGATRDIRCRATIIASSNRDLFAEVGAGRFRRDLYYRLAVFPFTVPPLRDPQRRSDIGLLAEYFIRNSTVSSRHAVGLDESARRELLAHAWPGNARELRNVIDRALILEKSDRITAPSILIDRPAGSAGPAPAASGPEAGDLDRPYGLSVGRPDPDVSGLGFRSPFSLETAEREFILRALKETGWQRTRAAALLGITRATLHAKLKRYDIRVPAGVQ